MIEGHNEGETGSGAVLVAAGEDRQLEELTRLVETLGLEVLGRLEEGPRGGGGARRGESAGVGSLPVSWRRLVLRSWGAWSRAAGTAWGTSGVASGQS